ncbi:MAG: phasin family protein [Gammaproteobacteria bacterium]|nr:phasin family protein [Gammaproteobacteria bacterium]
MTNEYIESLKERADELLAPVQKLNQLNISNIKKLLALQTASLQAYSELGSNRLKAAFEINDAPALVDYLSGQVEFTKTISEQVVSDTKITAEFSKEYRAEVQKIAEENVSAISSSVA